MRDRSVDAKPNTRSLNWAFTSMGFTLVMEFSSLVSATTRGFLTS